VDVSPGASGNIAVVQDATTGNLTIDTNPDLVATSVTTGNTVMDTSGVTVAGGANPVSLTSAGLDNGGNKIVNVAAGEVSSTSTDAVNGAQLYATDQDVSNNTTAITQLGDTITAVAGDTSTTYVNENGRGVKYVRTNDDGLAPDDAHAQGQGSTAVGYQAATAMTAANAVAIGRAATVSNAKGVAIGDGATVSNDGAVALGAGSSTSAAVAVAGGTINGTTYAYAGTAPASVVSMGSAGHERQVANVAAGQVTATSTDAVNGSQLYATNQAVNDIGTTVTTINNGGGIKYFHAKSSGADSAANGDDSVAVGPNAVANGASSIAQGNGAVASGDESVAIGKNAKAQNGKAVSIGSGNTAEGDGAVAIGNANMAIGEGSVALGDQSQAAAAGALAFGNAAMASFANDVALGSGSVTAAAVATATATINGTTYAFAGTAPTSTVSVGSAGNERTITNMAAGRINAASTDAVNGSQLYATNQAVDSLGEQVDHISNGSSGMFRVSQDRNTPPPAPTGSDSAAGGADAVASGNSSLAVGNGSTASGDNSTALGNGAIASGAGSTAVGQGAVASADGSVALGNGSSDGGRGAESYTGKYSGAQNDTAGTVSVGNAATGETRTISNVADAREATDAVNLRQLDGAVQAANDYTDTRISEVNGSVTNIQDGSDGMFQVSQDANSTKPKPTGAKSVAGGNNAVASGNNSTALGDDAQATASNSVAIGQGSVADRADSVSVGAAGKERQITNVAAGTADTDAVNVGQLQAAQAGSVQYDRNTDGSVNQGSVTLNPGGGPATIHNVQAGTSATDAVNVGQLNDGLNKAMDWSKSYTDARFQSVNHDLNVIGNRANAGIASAIAMASLPQAYQPDQNAASVALGNFHGETGIAIGVSKISESGRYVFKLNASDNTRGDAGVGVGAGIVW
jgi:autotransporter adhesin